MNQVKLEESLNLFVEGTICRADFDQLLYKLKTESEDENFNSAIDKVFEKIEQSDSLTEPERGLIYQSILSDKRFEPAPETEPLHKGRTSRIWSRLAIAASILILISTGLYFFKYSNKAPRLTKAVTKPVKIVPGGDKAVLTLSDGSRIILDNARNGVLANQEGVSIQKTSKGKLLYTFSNSGKAPETTTNKLIYNKIETPKGGKYQINLPDGSQVWLNASSSLRFPALFAGKTREVELSGEAFFKVAHNKNKPFKVIAKDQVVEVLGTQFNINSYSDEESIKTTLIEGSVKILYHDQVVMLGPGQQFQPKDLNAKIVSADTDEVVAWKNGYFLFKNENIQSVMRKLSRWYDVEISYIGDIPHVGFGGNISRSREISDVLNALQLTNAVHFKIEGRRITVMP